MVHGKGKLHKKFQELFVNINNEFANFLDKSNNGKSIEKLSSQERENFWQLFFKILSDNFQSQDEDQIASINNLLELFLIILSNSSYHAEEDNQVIKILTFINSNALNFQEAAVKNSISLINEHWMIKRDGAIIPNMEYFTLKYLLDLCLSEKFLVSNLQRLSSIRKVITTAPFESAVPSLRPLLVKLVQSVKVLNSEHGQRFIASVLILSQKTMLDIHKTIMLELSSCVKKKSASYAKVYVTAWQNANDEMRNLIEKTCFQHLMESFLKEQRGSLELTKTGQNLLSVLEVWHSERKKKNSDFITMITDCYQPIIWKYLESCSNVFRCNAVDLLFKAFPLQRPGDNVMNAERLFNEQFAAMTSALRDDCHIVRIIAVREVCNILAHYWNSFTPVQIHKLLTIISKENAHDASAADVRRMVYVGFQSFLNNPLSFQYLNQILPAMADNIHDVNQKVRTAFIQLLIAIKGKEDPNIKYGDLVPTFSLYYRLAEENIKVGQLIVKLLLSSYYQEKTPSVEWLKRFIFLIKTYTKSYRNFFLYSENVLPFPDALRIMCDILVQLGSYVVSKTSEENIDPEGDAAQGVPKKIARRSGKKEVLKSSNTDRNSAAGKEQGKEDGNRGKVCAFDEPIVVEGLFDIVTILWVLHDNKLNQPENQDKRVKLYETYLTYAQPFINYYKETNLFHSVLCLSGNIPSSLLRSNSITLPGYCMKMLKSECMSLCSNNKEYLLSILVALIKWGKGGDVLEQVALWLDAAFETQDLNATILPRRKVKINETIQPNSVVAILILDTLMKTEYVKMSILKKNYRQLFELWKFMSRIKKITETRLEQGEPFEDDLLSDEFIMICFRRYIQLVPLLKNGKCGEREEGEEEEDGEKDEVIDCQEEVEGLMKWAEDVLFGYLEGSEKCLEKDLELIISIYKDILYVSDNIIILNVVKRQFYLNVGRLVLKLLETRHGPHFLRSASRIAAAINYSGKMLFSVNDDLKIFSKIVPCLVSNILNVFTSRDLSEEEIGVVDPVLGEVKNNLGKILDTYHDNFKLKKSSRETVRHLQTLTRIFLDALVNLLARDLSSESAELPVYKNLGQFPPLVNAILSLFYNRKFWGSMFVHVWNKTLEANVYDSKSVVASIVILYLYVNNDKKANKIELRKTVLSMTNILKSFKSEMEKRSTEEGNTDLIDLRPDNFREGSPSSAVAEADSLTNGRVSEFGCLPEGLIQQGLDMLTGIQEKLCRMMEEEE